MLSALHTKINNIVPITSIEKVSDTNYSIEFVNPNNISNEQLSLIHSIIDGWPLEEAKTNKLKDLDIQWNNQLNDGFQTPYGWSLGLQNSDVTLLTGAFLLAKEAANMNLSQNATIIDTSGISHTLSIQDFTILMLQYGQYRSELSSHYASVRTSIENAQSFEDLDNIQV